MTLVLARIDQRLIHGIVVTQWTGETKAKRLMVVDDIISKDEAQKAALLKERRRKKRVDGICGVIMLVSTIVALVWLFVAPGWTSGSLAHLFWLPWVVGGIACGIVSVLAETFGEA